MATLSAPAPVKPGLQTTELWGKLAIQVLLIANAMFHLGLQIDDQLTVQLVAGLEAAYTIGRAVTKAKAGSTVMATPSSEAPSSEAVSP